MKPPRETTASPPAAASSSGPAPRGIAEVLAAARERLDLPQPAKSRILLELAADLEDLETAYRRQGLTPEEALRRAVETCDLSDEALAELVRIHQSWYRRLMDRFSEQARARWERGLLLVLLLFIALTSGAGMIGRPVVSHAGPFVWPLLASGLLALALGLQQAHRLFIRKDHRPSRLRGPLAGFAYLAGLELLLGLAGFTHGLAHALSRTLREIEMSLPHLHGWLVQTAALEIVCLLTFTLTALLGFALLRKVASIEQAEVAHLLGGRR